MDSSVIVHDTPAILNAATRRLLAAEVRNVVERQKELVQRRLGETLRRV